MRLGIPRHRNLGRNNKGECLYFGDLCSSLIPSPGPICMGSRAARMRFEQRRWHQTYPHRDSHYRHPFACHCPVWLVPHAPRRRRLIWSTRRPLETGAVNGHSFDSSSLASSLCFCCKGVTWLALAAFAEIPPVVCSLSISPHLSVQILASRYRYSSFWIWAVMLFSPRPMIKEY